jgi:hypothetical protein
MRLRNKPKKIRLSPSRNKSSLSQRMRKRRLPRRKSQLRAHLLTQTQVQRKITRRK